MFVHEKTMLPIYRKNHIKSFASRSPDLRSPLRSPFPNLYTQFQWLLMLRSSLLQWRDRTGFTPVSLLICPKSTFQSRRIFRQNLQRLVQNQQMLFIYNFIIYYIFFHVQKCFFADCIFLYTKGKKTFLFLRGQNGGVWGGLSAFATLR